jgi:hypothetical protein
MSMTGDEIAAASLQRLRDRLATVWEQHDGDRTWVADLTTGDYVIITGKRKSDDREIRMTALVMSNIPSFEFVIVRLLDVYSPNMIGRDLTFLYNGKAARLTLEHFEYVNIFPDDRLGQTMDGDCER